MDKVGLFQDVDLNALGLTRQEESKKKNDDLQQTDFMTLLVAQLENQDPMKPQDNAEFVSQLSQFSMLDGISLLNKNFETLASAVTSSQALQASSLVGQSVVIPANMANYQEGDSFYGSVDLPSSVIDLELKVNDASGTLVRRDLIGSASEGNYPFQWDGKDESGNPLPSGNYTVTATATVGGESTAIQTNLTFNVDSVTLGKNGEGIILNLAGHDSVSMDEVKEIR